MKSVLTFFVFFCLFASPLFAQVWYENGEPVPDTEWRRSKGDLGVMQLLTHDPNEFLENWLKPEDPEIIFTNETTKGKLIAAFILFQGCQADNEGNCNLEVAYRVMNPVGEIYADTGGIELWKNKPAPKKGILSLGVSHLSIIIELEDLFGEYLVYAAVRDLNSGNQILTLQRFTVVEEEK